MMPDNKYSRAMLKYKKPWWQLTARQKKMVGPERACRGWELEPSSKPDYMIFDSKRRSRVYKGQPDSTVVIKKYQFDESKWTYDYGQAAVSTRPFETREKALEAAREDIMCSGPTIGESWPKE